MLSIRNLVKVYPGPVAALQGVSLEIPSGMFGLLGPNGAEEPAFMRILAGALRPASGNLMDEMLSSQSRHLLSARLPPAGLRLLPA
jgi:ABC-type multidrug transport system ATPase subunit